MDRNVSDVDQVKFADIATATETLAGKHYEMDSGLTRIFRITVGAGDEGAEAVPIRLLEVNENTPESGIMPLHFGAAPASGIPFPSVIIEVSPDEFRRIQSSELMLPEGWSIGDELPRRPPAAENL
jgi:hypothetical protein